MEVGLERVGTQSIMTDEEKGTEVDSEEEVDPEDTNSVDVSVAKGNGEWCLGLTLLGVVVVIWTLSSVVVQHIYHEMNFEGPFFLTYIGSCLFTIYLPIYAVGAWCFGTNKKTLDGEDREVEFTLLSDFDDDSFDEDEDPLDCEAPDFGDSDNSLEGPMVCKPYTVWETFKVSLLVCPLWFMANYTYNCSLEYTR